ncbi:unnamed protein product, partial [Ilex paraguariensis]
MGNPSLSIRVAFVLSLSLAASYTTSSHSPTISFLKSHSNSPDNPNPKPNFKASASDLLSLLGTSQQASAINAEVAQELRSCFKFLVPFTPSHLSPHSDSSPFRRALSSKLTCSQSRTRREEDELIWWPPAPVMELARLAVDSGGDPGAIHRTLDPKMIP